MSVAAKTESLDQDHGWTPDSNFSVGILCHPCTPVEPEELEDWLQAQVDRLQSSGLELVVRWSRLSQRLPDSEIAAGWLIDLELVESSPGSRDRLDDLLADLLTDLRFLGMEPRLLLPMAVSELPSEMGRAAAASASASPPIFDYPGLT